MIFPPMIEPPCKHLTELFFNPHREEEAAALCEECPVIDDCRSFAYTNQVEYGVWGGTTAAQRRWEWRPFCKTGCGHKARPDYATCADCGKRGRKPKGPATVPAEDCLAAT